MPPNMMNAAMGSSPNVTGSSTATVSAGPIPGSTPIAVPSVVPINAHPRFASVSAPAKPPSSEWSVVMRARQRRNEAPRSSEPAREHAGRQRQLEHLRKHEIRGGGNRDRARRVAHGPALVERARDEPKQHGRRDQKARALHEQQVRDRAGSDQRERAPLMARVRRELESARRNRAAR